MSAHKLVSKARLLTRTWNKTFLQDMDAFIFDCDGVLWTGHRNLPGAAQTLNELKRLGKQVFFCTNSSLKSRNDVAKKLLDMGVTVDLSTVYSTSSTTASYIAALPKSQFDPKSQLVLVVGSQGIMQELAARGIPYKSAEDYLPSDLDAAISYVASDFKPDPKIGAVVVGIDNRITYPKAAYAAAVLRELPHTIFISTNQDFTYPGTYRKLPGAGSCLAIVKTASGREPVNMGKPSTQMMEAIIRDHNLESLRASNRIMMVGDRLDTDVMFANATGVNSLLVFTGVTAPESISPWCCAEDSTQISDAIARHRSGLNQIQAQVQPPTRANPKSQPSDEPELPIHQLPTFLGTSVGSLIGLDATPASILDSLQPNLTPSQL